MYYRSWNYFLLNYLSYWSDWVYECTSSPDCYWRTMLQSLRAAHLELFRRLWDPLTVTTPSRPC